MRYSLVPERMQARDADFIEKDIQALEKIQAEEKNRNHNRMDPAKLPLNKRRGMQPKLQRVRFAEILDQTIESIQDDSVTIKTMPGFKPITKEEVVARLSNRRERLLELNNVTNSALRGSGLSSQPSGESTTEAGS